MGAAIAQRQKNTLYGIFVICLFLNIAFWQYSHRHFPKWPNVPPPPAEHKMAASFLGDRALAYRVGALVLQNFGNTGGNYEPLKNYNYQYLGEWFQRLDAMDPHSDFVPFLAAYYFGATQTPQDQLQPVISYLEKAGARPEAEKWRWLAQAVFLARHRMKDPGEALRLAKELGKAYRPGMPAWVLQMEAMVSNDVVGDKQAAYALMKALLATETEHMQPQEVNFMIDYICTRILTPVQATHEAMCANNPLAPKAP